MAEFLEVLSFPFMRRALIVGVIVSLCAALLGVVLVLKRYSLIGHGLGEVGFAALALAMALGLPPMPVAIPLVVAASFLIMYLSQRGALAGDGKPRVVTGDLQTIMAGLACGEPNTLSWDILRNHVSAFVSCPDWVSAKGMRMLGVPVKGDPTVISGESGAVGMGCLDAIMCDDTYRELREALELDRFSQVLLFSTEGNTDPLKFRRVIWDGEYPTTDSPQKEY